MERKEITVLIVSEVLDIEKIILEKFDKESFEIPMELFTSKNLASIDEIQPDLIVIDIINEEESIGNIESIKINNRFNKTPIMIVIEDGYKKNIGKFIEQGVKDYIVKPYDKQDLIIRFRNFFEYVAAIKLYKNRDLQFYALLNNTSYMAWFKDKKSNYIIVNNEFKEHSGKELEVISGRDDNFVWDGKIGEKCREYDLEVMNERKQIVFDEVIEGKKGYRQFNIHKSPVLDEYDNVIGTIGVARDITDLKNKDAELNIIIENIPFAVCLKSNDGTILNINSKFEEYTNLDSSQIIGLDMLGIENFKIEEDIRKEDLEIIKEKKSKVFERHIKVMDKERLMEIYKSPVFDISDEVIGIVALFRDVTEERKMQKHIKKLAYTDALTNLQNRRSLYKYVDCEISKKGLDLTLMIIDLDNFKKLNDSCGHSYGDEALILIANKLKIVCKDAFVGRIGGDEFVVVWENIKNENELRKLTEEILLAIKMEFNKGGKTNIISASIGVVTSNWKDNSIETLLLKGDLALYKAKEKGKNQYVMYTESLEKERIFNLKIERDLRDAVKNDEIDVYYQPQYTSGKELKGFEALFRWKNTMYKDVPVIDLIRIMEECNIIDEISNTILKKAFRFAKRINENSKNIIIVSINISGMQIMNDNFVDKFKDLIKEIDVSPNYIGIEITETVLLSNIDDNIKKIKSLKDLGITISLDDFGTGYSSLNYLIKLPLSQVKIDRSFIQGMNSRYEYIKLVKLIINLAHSISMLVIAEGVEKVSELKILEEINIDYIQGYLFSKPVNELEAENLTRNKSWK